MSERRCPHCHEELPDLTEADLAEILGGLELTRATEAPTGVGRWTEDPCGSPAFIVDLAALREQRERRLREHAEERRKR